MFSQFLLMALFKLRLDFAYLRDNDMDNFARGVVSKLSGNPDFPLTNPPLADIETLTEDYLTALTKAVNGSKSNRIDKNLKKAALINALRMLARDLISKAGNSELKLSKTGFKVFDTSFKSVTDPGIPKGLVLKHGSKSGEIIAICNRVLKVKTYETRYTTDNFGPEARWISAPASTRRKTTISGLKPGRIVWVQKRTFNTKGYSEWSKPVKIMVV